LDIDTLHLDERYQRGEVSAANTKWLADNLDWKEFGTLLVMQRANGKCFVVDGRQRLTAIRLRGDIERVPCIVSPSSGVAEEAARFLDVNVKRKNVSALERFKSAVTARMEPQMSIAQWLDANKFIVSPGAHKNTIIDFAATLIQTWKGDQQACQRALLIQRGVLRENEGLDSSVHKGFVWLLHGGVTLETYVDKLIRLGGKLYLQREIKAAGLESNTKGGQRTCGLGILRALNHKVRNKLVVVDRGGRVAIEKRGPKARAGEELPQR